MSDTRNVDAARGDVGRDQNTRLPFLEGRDGTIALPLAFVAVDGDRREAGLFEMLHQAFGTVLRAGKHKRAVVAMRIQQGDQKLLLLVLCHEVNGVRDLVGNLAGRRDFDADGIGQIVPRQLCHGFGHGGREHHGLTILVQGRSDATERVDEADVEHLVRLVQDQKARSAEIDGRTVHEVDQASGRGHENVRPARQPLGLCVDGLAADDKRDPQVVRQAAQRGNDLRRQFAGRCEDQAAHGFCRCLFLPFRKRHHQRDTEGGCLAGAGLGDAEHVARLKRVRDGFRLDGGRVFQSHGIEP